MRGDDGVIRLAGFEYPRGEVPKDFEDLLNVGRKSWTVECFGYMWEYNTIDEWEGREVTKRGAGLDDLTRSRLMKVDFLTQSIVRAKKLSNSQVFEFIKEADKVLLRTILLSADPKVIGILWDGYTIGVAMADKEFEAVITDLRTRMSQGFFVFSGASSEPAEEASAESVSETS